MSKLYNNQSFVTSSFSDFFESSVPDLRKTHLNIIPSIIYGMIVSESVVASDIAKVLKDSFSFIQLDSITKRIRRFFNNDLFNPYNFYESIIRYVIKSYKKKHSDNRVHIILDHMFSHDNYTVFMISMRLGKQSIPLWFRCFDGNDDPEAFHEDTLKYGIKFISDLFDPSFDLIFLADRWFNSSSLMDYIDSLGHTYCFRMKKNIHVSHYDKKEKHIIRKFLSDLGYYKYHSTFYENISITNYGFKTNIVISQSKNVNEPWIIATNGDVRRAIKDYSYRFGGIECMFKNQKSNGFNLEKVSNASLKAFTSMYSLVCLCTLYLTILGADYSKNSKCYKNERIVTHKTYYKRGKVRVLSLFNTGLTLFNRAINSLKYIRLPFSFKLYDI